MDITLDEKPQASVSSDSETVPMPSEGNADESSFPPDQGGEFTEMDDDDGKLPF